MFYRLKHFFKNRKFALLGRGRLVRRRRKDLPEFYWVREGTSDETVETDVFRPHYGALDFDSPERIDTIIDAGANIGLRSIWFAVRYPRATILAVEPEDGNFRLLQKNTAAYPNIRCIQAGLWRRDGFLRITNPEGPAWSFTVEEIPEAEASDRDLRAVTITSLMREYGFERIGILKIDIEGSEKEVFENSGSWIDRVDFLMVELHDRKKPGCAKTFFHAVGPFDYRLFLHDDNVIVKLHGGPR